MFLNHAGKSIVQIAQSNEKKSSGKTSHSCRSLSKWTHRIRNRARTNIPDQSARIPGRAFEVVPDNRPTTSSSARIRIALDTGRAQGSSPEQALCELCMDLNLLFEIVRLRSFESLGTCGAEQYSIAAQQGCQGCAAITEFLSELSYRWCRSLKLPAVGNTTYFKLRSLLAQFVYGGNYNLNRLQIDSIDISCYADRPSPWSELGTASLISGDTGSDQAVAWVRQALDRCMSQHSACVPTGCHVLPTRVLRIDGPNDVKLHVTANETSHYLCLSHCWGRLPLLQTTSVKLAAFQMRIPWEELPRTFQDAISFTYRIGYKYLWIDSLCIVQDSANDWRHEGSKMASIYKNAHLTLAATRSSDSNGGCFVNSKARHISRRWKFTDPQDEIYEIHTRQALDHADFMQWRLPLSTRAWAFQERLLSPRILHFTENELIWECSERIECECSGIYGTGWNKPNKMIPRPDLWADQPLPKVDRQWQEIVSLYKTKCLTFDKDIFPALQGLAKMIPPKMGPYLAGLWSHTLATNLTWYVLGDLPGARHKEWHAPTWSWASVTRQIEWTNIEWHNFSRERDTCVTHITVIDANVSAIGDDVTGEIRSGEIIITGHGLFGQAHYDEEKPFDQFRLALRCPDGTTLTISKSAIVTRFWVPNLPRMSSPEVFWDYDFTAAGQYKVPNGTDILAMRIEQFSNESRTRYMSAWLLLKHCSHDSGSFERIGLLHVYDTGLLPGHVKTSLLEQALEASPEIEIRIV